MHFYGMEPWLVELEKGTVIHVWLPARPSGFFLCGTDARKKRPKQPSILLLHGFGGSAIFQWLHQVPALLGAGYAVYMPDLVFFGGSFSSDRRRSLDFQALCMARLMETLGVAKYTVNGISYGGLVAYK